MLNIQKNISLAPHTYFKIGGLADFFVEVKTTDELIDAVSYAIKNNLNYLVLGGGSNVLISGEGYRGLVIKNKTSQVKQNKELIQADSGVTANYLIRYTLDEALAGLEEMLGLPGTVGGATYNNSHHLDKLWGEHIYEVEAIDPEGKINKFTQKDCKFAYDYSIFHENKNIILTVSFLLKQGDKNALWEIANNCVKRRATTQPLGVPSSGCMFKNISLADKMRLGISTQSAGYLIDKAGLKGLRVGGASVSTVHANFIVNDHNATYHDVKELISQIKHKIKETYGVDLREEVIIY